MVTLQTKQSGKNVNAMIAVVETVCKMYNVTMTYKINYGLFGKSTIDFTFTGDNAQTVKDAIISQAQ